jgi:thiosulfate/3-mercaptopyruvate sulfurtransferase
VAYQTLISAAELAPRTGDSAWVLLDCRFELADPEAGERAYLEGHIPGAQYANLDRDLSASPTGSNGRHPLPGTHALAARFETWGISAHHQVVAYDAGNGIAARLWWCLRSLGHAAAAVLDGGWPAWVQSGGEVRSGSETRPAAVFRPGRALTKSVLAEGVLGMATILDARAPERYRGDIEPVDRVAGHIPGAVNHPWTMSLDEHGEHLPVEILRRQLSATLSGAPIEDAVVYCGSGVTACNVILAAEHAGLGALSLYAGSWSEWCSDPTRPVATGPSP